MSRATMTKQQNGSTLLIALAILSTVTIITLGATRSALMELRMANNSAAKSEANHYAQSGADWLLNAAIIASTGSTPLLPNAYSVDQKVCTHATDTDAGSCSSNDLVIDSAVTGGGGVMTLIATRENCPPLPGGNSFGTCYQIESRYRGQGNATVVMGVRLP